MIQLIHLISRRRLGIQATCRDNIRSHLAGLLIHLKEVATPPSTIAHRVIVLLGGIPTRIIPVEPMLFRQAMMSQNFGKEKRVGFRTRAARAQTETPRAKKIIF